MQTKRRMLVEIFNHHDNYWNFIFYILFIYLAKVYAYRSKIYLRQFFIPEKDAILIMIVNDVSTETMSYKI